MMNASDDVNNPQMKEIREWLTGHIADHLNTSPDAIDVNEPFESFGMTSKEMVMISGDLEEWLDRRLEPTLVWQYPTIESISQFLAGVENEKEKVSERQIPERTGEPIAIIGMGCRFPGGDGPEAFWELLLNGKDAISRLPRERWEKNAVYDPQYPFSEDIEEAWGGYIQDLDQFDNEFFKISPREAASIDPQQRLLLEVTWEALEHGGIVPKQLRGSSTGVFVGISTSDYSMLQLSDPSLIDAYAGTGNAHSVAANRLSYFFDFQGPSLAIDTACSSSLVSVHLAVQCLKNGECDLALAGGVNLLLSPGLTITFSEAQMLAADGRCKTFDARADGYVRGEGCGMVVLKRLSNALRDQDRILGLIRGSAINHDGKSNGLTAPNGLSQQAVIRSALSNANLDPGQLQYLEAHGTGTRLGDPIEFNALKSVFKDSDRPRKSLALGSVKTNIGHLEAAAGIAALIKVVLALENGIIPPHLHLQELNPQISLEGTPFTIPTSTRDWPVEGQGVRYAGISSFGFGGTNAHMILEGVEGLGIEEALRREEEGENPRPLNVFCLSAIHETALKELASKYISTLESNRSQGRFIGDLCYSANTGRQSFDSRAALLVKDEKELKDQLTAFAKGRSISSILQNNLKGSVRPKTAFLFTGQGSQYVGMAKALYETEPTFRDVLDQCEAISRKALEPSLLSVIFSDEDPDSLIHETAYTQPALFSIEMGLATLLREWGVEPDLVLGHSIGEFAAACFAGAFSLEDGLRLVLQRGRLMQGLPRNGSMAVIFAEIDQVRKAVEAYRDEVSIATLNGPTNIVISGKSEYVEKVGQGFEAQGIECRRLEVSHAFHSPLMDSILEPFRKVADDVRYEPFLYPLASNLTGQVFREGEVLTADYWVRHVREPVLFSSGLEKVVESGVTVFVEIGPSPVLLGMAKRLFPEPSFQWLPTLRKGKPDWWILLHTLATLYIGGVEVDWKSFDQDYDRKRISLPTYPFSRKRFWFEKVPRSRAGTVAASTKSREPAVAWLHELIWEAAEERQQVDKGVRKDVQHLIFADQSGTGESIAQAMEEYGQEAILVYPGGEYEKTGNRYTLNPNRMTDFGTLFEEVLKGKEWRILHLWSLDAKFSAEKTKETLQKDLELSCISSLHMLQALDQNQKSKAVKISTWFITEGAQQVGVGTQRIAVSQAPLWGLARTAALEYPELWGGLIDLDPDNDREGASQVLNTITSGDLEDQVAFREGKRYIARLTPTTEAAVTEENYVCDPDGVYLVTGGTGVLGLSVVRRLIERGGRHFILFSRTDFSSGGSTGASESDEALSQKRKAIQDLEDMGAEIKLVPIDVADDGQMEAFFKDAHKDRSKIKGIIHMAGVVEPGPIRQISPEAFDRVLRAKVYGTWLLHKFAGDFELDFLLFFSSASSILNSPLLGSYAAANAFLDAMAHYRNWMGKPALSINWGFWGGGGMAHQYQESMGRTLVPKGMVAIQTETGLDYLEKLLRSKKKQVAVLPTDWEEWSKNQPRIRNLPLFSNILKAESVYPGLERKDLAEAEASAVSIKQEENLDLYSLPPEQWGDYLVDYLVRSTAAALYMDPKEIDPGQNLMELGIDSLMVMELTGNLEKDFEITVYPREVFERPSIRAFAEYLEGEIKGLHPEKIPTEQDRSSLVRLGEPQLKTNYLGIPVGIGNYHKPVEKNPRAVFILSSPRTGSTLLRVMLAGHSRLFCPPELHLLPFEDMRSRWKNLGESYLGEGLIRALMEINQVEVEASKDLVDGWIESKKSIEDVYGYIQKKIGPNLLVDKSPSYAIDLEVLERAEILFEQPNYLFLTRHPYAVIESFVRNRIDKVIGIEGIDPLDAAEHIWTEMNANILDFFSEVGSSRCHLIQYETLVSDTEAEIKKICQFLDVEFQEAIMDPYGASRMTDGLFDGSRPIGDPNFLKHDSIDSELGEKWKGIQLTRRLGGYSKRIAKELGYELPFEFRRTGSSGTFSKQGYDKKDKVGIAPLSRERHRVKSSGEEDGKIDDSLKNRLFDENG